MESMNKQMDSVRDDIPSLVAPAKNLYKDSLRAELLELQSDTDLLFKQLQSLSRQRLSQSGSVQ